jgi:nucleoside 2-deoxyribosyltransferase
MKIYLSGPIFLTTDKESKLWREEAKKRLSKYEILDPMERDYRGKTRDNYKEIVENDKKQIDNCDIMLVNHTKPSVGTSMEILYAWENDKRIFTIVHSNDISPWLLYHCEKLFKSLDSGIIFLNELYISMQNT